MAREDRLPEVLNVRYPFVQRHESRKPAEEENEDGYDHKTPWCNGVIDLIEVLERYPSADVNETSTIEQQI